ncbi:MAG: hypothetical protein ACRCX2_38005 [Paraclostridium sp.]
MTKDKKYIENLFRNYKKNVARIKILELNQVSDEDRELASINYTQKLKMGNIQTSNMQSLDDIIIMREQELIQLRNDVAMTEIFLESLNEKDRLLIDSFYIKEMKAHQVATLLDYFSIGGFWYAHKVIMENLYQLI